MKFSIKKYFQVLGGTLGIIILCVCLVLGFIRLPGADEFASGGDGGLERLSETGRINMLVMCTDEDGLRTDAMMLMSYDIQADTVTMLSMPRDLRLYVGNRYQKMNAAHAFYTDGQIGGPVATCEAVTRITGVPINYYVDFSFAAVAKIIDELGPVYFDIPDLYRDGVGMVYDDPVQNLHIKHSPGPQYLNGEQVVHLLRYRQDNHGRGYVRGDEERIEVQQAFLKTLTDQKLNAALIPKIPGIYQEVMSSIKTNLSVGDVARFSKYFANFASSGLHAETVAAVPTSAGGESVLIPNMPQLQEQVKRLFGVDGNNMWYADPSNRNPVLSYGGYMTLGGYVRTTNVAELNNYQSSSLTNDELCLINNVSMPPVVDHSAEQPAAGAAAKTSP